MRTFKSIKKQFKVFHFHFTKLIVDEIKSDTFYTNYVSIFRLWIFTFVLVTAVKWEACYRIVDLITLMRTGSLLSTILCVSLTLSHCLLYIHPLTLFATVQPFFRITLFILYNTQHNRAKLIFENCLLILASKLENYKIQLTRFNQLLLKK